MTDTTVSDAVVFPQDDGSGVADGSEDYSSAAYFGLLAKYKGDGSYVGEDETGTATLQFNDVDTTNEEVDVSPGYAFIMDGNHAVQAGANATYGVNLPNKNPYVVALPTEVVNLSLGADTTNDVWLAVDPTSNDSVYIRHGSGLTAPTDPSIKLGTVNSSDGSTTRANDLATSTAFGTGGVSNPMEEALDAAAFDISNVGAFEQGTDPRDVITEATSPTGFGFTGDSGRDIHDKTDVTISNGTTASVTEDVTVTLYDGVDNTGAQVTTETQSVTVGASSSSTVTFISTDAELDNVDYYLEVMTSGTTLSVDQTDEYTKGATYERGQTNTGDYYLRNQDGNDVLTADPISGKVGVGPLDAGQETISKPVVRAFGGGGTFQDYLIADYASIFDAAQTALNNGAQAVELPASGTYSTGTTLTVGGNQAVVSRGSRGLTVTYTGVSNGIEITGNYATVSRFEVAAEDANVADAINCQTNPYRIKVEDMITSGDWTAHISGDAYSSKFESNVFLGGTGDQVTVSAITNRFAGNYHFGIPSGSWGQVLSNDNTRIVGCAFTSEGANGGGTNPAGGVKVDNNATGWVIQANFENMYQADGVTLAGVGVQLGDSAAVTNWNDGVLLPSNVRNVDTAVRVDNDASGAVSAGRIKGLRTNGVNTGIDAASFATGLVFCDNIGGINIANDLNNRVIGRSYDGDPVVRADDGSDKYKITVDGTGSISTTLV